MSFQITNEEQPECDTPKRAIIHALKKDTGWSIDEIALKESTEPLVVEQVLKGGYRRPDNPKYPVLNKSKDPSIFQRPRPVPFPPKNDIHCVHTAKYVGDLHSTKPDLIFTHGARGTLQADAVANFINGFITMSTRKTILAFEGNMNLKSRVNMFKAVIDHHNADYSCLGGRSMGARAAVMAATEQTTCLVLVSYPLHTDKDFRDQILLDIPVHMKVIFVNGDNDEMCDLQRLESVRNKMQCKTWRVVVHDTDHGMNTKPRATSEEIVKATGRVVASWLDCANEGRREGRIFWDRESEVVRWSGWSNNARFMLVDSRGQRVYASSSTSKASKKTGESSNPNKTPSKRNQDKNGDSNHTADGTKQTPKKRKQNEKSDEKPDTNSAEQISKKRRKK
ncbi:hypothetical protein MMC21_006035 [Puttea exsequens]|nr:hypothetical protein [Puttea exsequens]